MYKIPIEKSKKHSHIHTIKAKRCIEDVKKKNKDVNPYAICTASLGKEEAILPKHQKG